jgi:hypothetical protein
MVKGTMLIKGPTMFHSSLKITTQEMLLKMFSTSTCITTQSMCRLRRALMLKKNGFIASKD